MDTPPDGRTAPEPAGFLSRLRERGVLRVAASYAVIAWLALQIASVIFDPIGVPKWVLTALIITAAVGFPIAVALAWFLEIGEHGVQVDAAAGGVARPTVRGLRHYADAIVIGILLIAVVVLLVRQSDLGKPKPPENPAIAVLPFENLSGDPEQEYFSDGIAEEMLDRLGRVPGLRVIARSSSFGFKGKDVDARTIADKLGVTTLLEGSVRRDGKRLKLSARLIDGATGQQVWSGSFDREMNDVFAVQAELAGAIVNAIVPAALGKASEAAVLPTTDLNAYDLYLLARSQLALRLPESIQKSVDLMQQAVRLDPNFARAHAHLAASLLFQRVYLGDEDPDRSAALLRQAESSIHRALALDPNLSEAYDAYGNLLRDTGQPGAEVAYRQAIELNANNAAAWHDYSVFLGNTPSRRREGDDAIRRSLELDPRQPVTWANYLTNIASEGRKRFDEEFARATRMVGDMPGALGRFPVLIWAKDREGYRREFERALRLYAETPGALDGLALPEAAIIGFPVEVMKAGLAKKQRPSDADLPVWFNDFRAWLPVDAVRAEHSLPGKVDPHQGVDRQKVRLFLEADAVGLQGDWARLDRTFAALRERAGDHDGHVRSVMAFWLAVQGRYEEAAKSLELAGTVPDNRLPPTMGGDKMWGQMEAATVRIYRATGREHEARRMADELLDLLRRKWRAERSTCEWDGWMLAPMRYASLAASEGLKEEAVGALQDALRCGDLPYGFEPQLPWFRSLEGYQPYDALLQERERRVERLRAEMLQQQATADNVNPQPR